MQPRDFHEDKKRWASIGPIVGIELKWVIFSNLCKFLYFAIVIVEIPKFPIEKSRKAAKRGTNLLTYFWKKPTELKKTFRKLTCKLPNTKTCPFFANKPIALSAANRNLPHGRRVVFVLKNFRSEKNSKLSLALCF